jgi:hypothetical protein
MGKQKYGGGGLNYSLGVLIILLMVFWFVSKCIGQSGAHSYYIKPMSRNGNALHHVNTSHSLGGYHRTQYNKKSNVVGIPESNTSMRHLNDENAYKCSGPERSNADDKQVDIHLAKQSKVKNQKGPRSKTDSHELMCGTDHTRNNLYL